MLLLTKIRMPPVTLKSLTMTKKKAISWKLNLKEKYTVTKVTMNSQMLVQVDWYMWLGKMTRNTREIIDSFLF